jgi:hypothetical protein
VRALLTGSPALDQIPSNQCLDSTAPHPDQRGLTRPANGLCDIGAYEGVQPLFTYSCNLLRNGAAEDGGTSSGGKYVGMPDCCGSRTDTSRLCHITRRVDFLPC